VVKRQGDSAANGTIKRELGVLNRMLKLAYESGKLLRLPIIHKPKETARARASSSTEQYEAVRHHLRPDLQVAAAIAYGWRTQSEVLTLERRQVDLSAGTLHLEPGTTKNDDWRLVYLPPDLRAQIAAQVERVRALERQTGRIIRYLSRTSPAGTEAPACRKAGVLGKLRHDFRRPSAEIW
jgi:integrase